MKRAYNWLIGTLAVILLIISAFDLGVYINKSTKSSSPTKPQQSIAQKPSDEQGKVLGGGPCSPYFTIKDNNLSPSSRTQTEYYINNKYCVSFQNNDSAARFVLADDGSWSLELSVAGGAGSIRSKYFDSPGIYPFHLQSNPSAKGVFYAGVTADSQAPSVPGNLRTTAVSNTSVTLAWNASTDNVGVTGYKIYRNGQQIATTGSTSYTNSGLAPGTSYSCYVKAYDAAGNLSGASNTVSVSTALTIKDVVLPSTFTQAGSSTTNLVAITDPANVANLIVEVVGKNKIGWAEPVNLSSLDTANKFKSLDAYVKLAGLGIVELDSKTLPELNKKATITMFNLPFVSTPKVLVDGKINPKVVSNIKYSKGTLTFNTSHFTKFEAVPTLEVLEPKSNFTVNKPNITLKGKVTDPTASVSAKLNGKDLGKLKVATESGQFSKDLTLTKGNNTIVVSAVSKFGPPLVATVSGVFKPQPITAAIVLVGSAVLVVILIGVVGWWYYTKRLIKSVPFKPSENPTKTPTT